MKRLFNSLAALVGVWLLASFLGVMFDAAHKNLWTQSLMWALLSSVILAPVFVFVGTEASSPPPPNDEPFEVGESMEVTDQDAASEREKGWPYTEEEDPGSSSRGPVASSN